ncbi:M1 family metallopeptidase [Sphingomonas sp. ASV193]|uniref:M1 family metallopeptidase n=1 Tax=Sphingomonas sp. ASV193 TaxID=3144405 RepID=UPI0032E8A1D0
MTLRTRATLAAATSLLALAATPAIAQNGGAFAGYRDTVDTSLATQLPRTAVPHHYTLTITPDAPNLKFAGQETIDLQIVQPTDRLTLNAVDLGFGAVSIMPLTGGAPVAASVTTDADNQSATLAFGRTLAPGAYRLSIAYTGKINEQANGLFALDYKDTAGADKRSIFTQFEPADARRFFPSWDEPDYKAKFDLSAVIPANQMGVSNMPAARSEPIGNGMQRVTFLTTPEMSTYLLFFGAGEFGRVAKMATPTTEVGVVASKGNEAKSYTALDAQAQILPYYNSYFGYNYPLPKLDNVAGPGQSQFFGAMENWGAIFTFERILLDDPAVTTEGERQNIFEVDAHEMAHQWFGDLVTMGWWGDLWLNEGFASWMATKATKHFHPDWGAEYGAVGAREGAMSQDDKLSTHPIVQDVRTVEQANQAFDGITYSKGQSVITMLEAYATPDVWQRGIQAYMRAHAYQNSKTDQLWAAIEGAGARGLTTIAHDFTNQPGVPLIRVGASRCVGGSTSVVLTQDQFSADRKPGSFTPLSWHVPVTMSAGGTPVTVVTSGRTTSASVPGCGQLVVNTGQAGYYRTLYPAAAAARLATNFTALSPIDRYGVLDDQFSLSVAGYQPMGTALDILNAVPTDAAPELIGDASAKMSGIQGLLDGNAAAQAKVKKLIIARFGPVIDRIGIAPRDGEPVGVTTLRPRLIATLGNAGDPRIKAEAARLFTAIEKDPNAAPKGLKQTWLGRIAYDADAATWDRLHAMAKRASTATERQNLYGLLASAKSEVLARRALELALTSEPGKTISAGMIGRVAGSHPDLAFDFTIAHLAQVTRLVDLSAQSRYVARLASGSDKPEMVAKLDAYAKANVKPSDRKAIEEAKSAIKVRLANTPRIKRETLAWVNAKKVG